MQKSYTKALHFNTAKELFLVAFDKYDFGGKTPDRATAELTGIAAGCNVAADIFLSEGSNFYSLHEFKQEKAKKETTTTTKRV